MTKPSMDTDQLGLLANTALAYITDLSRARRRKRKYCPQSKHESHLFPLTSVIMWRFHDNEYLMDVILKGAYIDVFFSI